VPKQWCKVQWWLLPKGKIVALRKKFLGCLPGSILKVKIGPLYHVNPARDDFVWHDLFIKVLSVEEGPDLAFEVFYFENGVVKGPHWLSLSNQWLYYAHPAHYFVDDVEIVYRA